MPVLTTSKGFPWYAGIVERVEAETVIVKFPFQFGDKSFEYPKDGVIRYQSQFIGKKFYPLKKVPKLTTTHLRTSVLKYENNLDKYVKEQNITLI